MKNSKFVPFLSVILSFLTLFFTSCTGETKSLYTTQSTPLEVQGGHRSQPPGGLLILRTASKSELIDKIAKDYRELKSLKAAVKFTFLERGEGVQSYCQARFLWKRPKKILVKAYRELTPIFFTLASNETDFWFYIPRYNTAYTGYTRLLEMSSLGRRFDLGLDPYLLEISLQARPLGDNEFAQMIEVNERQYLLSILENKEGLNILRRKYWIDRSDLEVVREIQYSAQGIPTFEIKRGKFENKLHLSLPSKIEFTKLVEGKSVQMEFETRQINPEISDTQFEYKPPTGVIIETVN